MVFVERKGKCFPEIGGLGGGFGDYRKSCADSWHDHVFAAACQFLK